MFPHYLSRIQVLIITATLAFVGLFAFTLFKQQELENSATSLGCAVVYPGGDIIFPSYYNTQIEHHPGRKIFDNHCKACHRLDQKLVGPALRFSFQRNDSLWYRAFIKKGNALVASGDFVATELFKEYHQIEHPVYDKMNDDTLTKLVSYLKLEGEVGNIVP